MKIKLELDYKCLSDEKKKTGKLGGTERFFLLLNRYLKTIGYDVQYTQGATREFDVAIFSNSYNSHIKAKKKILFIGSWHAQPTNAFDEIVFVSEHTRREYSWKGGEVIYACIEPGIPTFKTESYVKNRIVTVANPNRFIEHANDICKYLERSGEEIEWCITGGNKLYTDQYPEPFASKKLHPYIKYQGVLGRTELLNLLASAHMFVYPNFTNNSETMGVSPIEAAALGIPVVVPTREPFYETMGASAYYVQNVLEAAEMIISLKKERIPLRFDYTEYSYDVVMEKWKNLIERVVNE